MAAYDDLGREVGDDRPVAWPLGVSRPLTLDEMIQRAIRTEMSRRAVEEGEESFEEADDFEVEEGEEFRSPYEITDMQDDLSIGGDREAKAEVKTGSEKQEEAKSAAAAAPGAPDSGVSQEAQGKRV